MILGCRDGGGGGGQLGLVFKGSKIFFIWLFKLIIFITFIKPSFPRFSSKNWALLSFHHFTFIFQLLFTAVVRVAFIILLKLLLFKRVIVWLPGQGLVLHFLLSLFIPGHLRPPLAGSGMSHDRRRAWIPSPQVVLQLSHNPQQLHPPWTRKVSRVSWYFAQGGTNLIQLNVIAKKIKGNEY